jgi:DUF2892 family protein/AcrB/AcrD/AcrF family protein
MGAFFTATSMIGFIAGAGIIVRNSIILVDFIELRRSQGMSLEEAVIDAGAVRFRPMLLSAAAVVVGASVILFNPIFQGLALSLMAGEAASTVCPGWRCRYCTTFRKSDNNRRQRILIRRRTSPNVKFRCVKQRDDLSRREQTMTIERTLRLMAGLFVLISLALGHWVNQYWYLFTAFVGLNLFQSGLTNWCPVMTLLRKLGVDSQERVKHA